ncbi:FecR domain-containing protein [Chitinophaga rhizophila]|uniref:FecR domain-containing protein n=1 Tax=Chitinophaga rhizophila TaxID=2866212 RepID=A0ABS7GMW7_9BACT|nr:FecR domain-containing protein [Chitinophaga rhizophila]MBW8688063.1 FecR domain-containing protein [Chitinophaga rhizophila]
MTKLYADEALYALLCKYVLGEADATERQWVEEWLKSGPDHPALLASLEKLLKDTPAIQVSFDDTERAWQSLSSRMGGPIAVHKRRSWWMAAAVLLIAAGTGLWWLAARSNRMQRYAGPVIAHLKDGSTVQLEEKALLLVQAGFAKGRRKVTLEGKALFTVTPDAAQPFIVTLGERTIKVLGTRFTVEAAGKDGPLRIHVDTGEVMVTDSSIKDSVILSAGMILEQQQDKAPFRIASHVTNAATRQLVFTDTPLSEVLQTVSLIYNIHLSADSTLLLLPVTATFTGETAENILASLAFMTNATVHKEATGMALKK